MIPTIFCLLAFMTNFLNFILYIRSFPFLNGRRNSIHLNQIFSVFFYSRLTILIVLLSLFCRIQQMALQFILVNTIIKT